MLVASPAALATVYRVPDGGGDDYGLGGGDDDERTRVTTAGALMLLSQRLTAHSIVKMSDHS
jgi:hypothetical protein